MKELIINEKNSGGRLDKILFRYLDKASSGFIYKMLRKKNITLNDKKASGGEIVHPGDSVKLYLSDETVAKFKSGLSVAEARKKDARTHCAAKKGVVLNLRNMIVYEDDNIVAVNKPQGLLSQKSKPEDISVNDFMLEYIHSDDLFVPGISNRLDRNTSGIILTGRNLSAARELNRIIGARNISKKYLALVKGRVESSSRIDAYLLKDEKTNKVTVSPEQMEGSSRIETAYVPLASNDEATLLEVDLITGKSHQIRAHLASEGHPLIGDTKYGDEETNERYREKYGLKFQLLHAYKVEFISAEGILEYLNGKTVEAPLPAMFAKILEGEGIWLPGAPEV